MSDLDSSCRISCRVGPLEADDDGIKGFWSDSIRVCTCLGFAVPTAGRKEQQNRQNAQNGVHACLSSKSLVEMIHSEVPQWL